MSRAAQITDLNISRDRQQRGQKIGLLLLIGQFLAIASILLIVSVNQLRTPSGISLKVLGTGACLIGFGVVLIFRRFRLESAKQNQLEQELRSSSAGAVSPDANALDYSEIEARTFNLKNIEFDPARLITEVVEVFSDRAQRKDLKLNTAIDHGLPTVVNGDPACLRRVLTNLMDNALKFTQHGEIFVRVSEAGSSGGRTKLQFEVGGSMIRGDETIGSGLPVSKKLVELMGGEFHVTSKLGHGSVFRFTAVVDYPRAAGDQPTAAAVSGPTSRKGSGRNRRMDPRCRVNHPTVLNSKDAGVAVVRVLDVSSTGIRVAVPFRLEVKSEVEIRVNNMTISGVVRNCVCKAGNEFHVGVEVTEPVSAGGPGFDQVLRRIRSGGSIPGRK